MEYKESFLKLGQELEIRKDFNEFLEEFFYYFFSSNLQISNSLIIHDCF